jgi:hypothetical protein
MQAHTFARAECIGRVALDRVGPWSSDIPTTATTAEFIVDGNCLVAAKNGVEGKRDVGQAVGCVAPAGRGRVR